MGRSCAHDLHDHAFAPLAVELGVEHLFPRSQIEAPRMAPVGSTRGIAVSFPIFAGKDTSGLNVWLLVGRDFESHHRGSEFAEVHGDIFLYATSESSVPRW